MDTVMSILDEAIVIHGADGELVFANPAAARMLGYETLRGGGRGPDRADPRALLDPRRERQRGRRRGARRAPGARRRAGRAADAAGDRPRDRARSAGRGRRPGRSRAPAGEVLYSVTAIEDVTDVKRAEFAQAAARPHRRAALALDRLPRDARARCRSCWCPSSPTGARSRSPRDDGLLAAGRDGPPRPGPAALLRELRERYPLRVDEPSRIGEVVRTGEPELIQPTDEWLRAIAANEEHLGLLREIGDGLGDLGADDGRRPRWSARSTSSTRSARGSSTRTTSRSRSEVARRVGARDRERADRRRAGPGRRRAAARAAAAEPAARCPAGRWRRCTSRRARSTRSAATSTRSSGSRGGWAVVLGDVSGKGAAAAALTAEARHTIRTAGALGGRPGRRACTCSTRQPARPRRRRALLGGACWSCRTRRRAASRGHASTSPGTRTRCCCASGSAEPVGEPGPAARRRRRPDLGAAHGHGRPGRPAGPLHRRRDRGARRRRASASAAERLRDRLAGCRRARARGRAGPRRARRSSAPGRREDDAALVAIRRAGSAEPATSALRARAQASSRPRSAP